MAYPVFNLGFHSNLAASCSLRNNTTSLHYQSSRSRLIVARSENKDASNVSRKTGPSLWRKELQQQQQQTGLEFSDESFLDRSVEQDMEGLSKKRDAEKQLSKIMNKADAEKLDEKGFVGTLVETLLVADFFFILFILAWFVAGLVEQAAFDAHFLLDAWFPLWPVVFQPALGFFMAGALWTALSKFLFKR